jgi:hypothetical protein
MPANASVYDGVGLEALVKAVAAAEAFRVGGRGRQARPVAWCPL